MRNTNWAPVVVGIAAAFCLTPLLDPPLALGVGAAIGLLAPGRCRRSRTGWLKCCCRPASYCWGSG